MSTLTVPRDFSVRIPAVVTDSPGRSGISATMGVPSGDCRVTSVCTSHLSPSTSVRLTLRKGGNAEAETLSSSSRAKVTAWRDRRMLSSTAPSSWIPLKTCP